MSEEKKATTRKRAGRKPKDTNAAPVERAKTEEPQGAPVETAENTPAAEAGNASEPSAPEAGGNNKDTADNNESTTPDSGSGQSGENSEQAAHAPDQNGDIPEQGAGQGGGEQPQAAPTPPAVEGWAVARVLKITKPLMKGEDVKALQTALIARRYHCGAGGASGVYERNTAYAVRCFQAANRLIVDGKAGRFTVAALGGTWNG